MSVALTKVISDIGMAVERANIAIEQYAAVAYMDQGYVSTPSNDADGEEIYSPLKYTITLPGANGNKRVQIPMTALVNHSTLSLAEVDVKLKFVLEESKDHEMMIRADSLESVNPLQTSEISLHFKTAEPSEGKARLENKHIQML